MCSVQIAGWRVEGGYRVTSTADKLASRSDTNISRGLNLASTLDKSPSQYREQNPCKTFKQNKSGIIQKTISSIRESVNTKIQEEQTEKHRRGTKGTQAGGNIRFVRVLEPIYHTLAPRRA